MFRIETAKFSEINLNDPLFKTLKDDYPNFVQWFNQKENETIFIVREKEMLLAILYLKLEENECDELIIPKMNQKRRIKISTFKVEKEGLGIGKMLMNFCLKEIEKYQVNEIYLTVHDKTDSHKKFISFIKKYEFELHGFKLEEKVFIKRL